MEAVSSWHLVVGTTYDIRDSRKGMFWGTLLSIDDEFGVVRIVSGKAKFISESDKGEGETLHVRFSHCKFYPIEEHEPVPVDQFGKDLWSTFAYVEPRAVDYKGKLDCSHMRTAVDRHKDLLGEAQTRCGLIDGGKYATQLRGGVKKEDHDDWDCIDDLIAADLLEKIGDPVYRLTELGWRVNLQLRQHKASGKYFASFEMEVDNA